MAKLRRLKACMVERGLNNKELGNIIGKTDGYISRMLNGSTIPRLDVAYQICDALEISRYDLPKYFPISEVKNNDPYHNRIKQRIKNGELVGRKFVDNHKGIGECMLLVFNTEPSIRPIRPERYVEYVDLLAKWSKGEFNRC